MTREEILAMDTDELSIAVAETIFKAKVIGKENDPNAKLLIGWYGEKAWKPMRGSWTSADWSPSEEIAWLDCPRFAEDISAAWEVADSFNDIVVRKYETMGGDFRYVCSIVNGGVNTVDAEDTAPLAICRAALLSVLRLEATP